ncbi:phosphatase PAP2 family protein [Apilactobacillus kunkeei]|uniref:phosphatase PAP2 family protein n=1 Tax=Apilactobacillus kunkeei TaxID=148814 RepID=UPI004033160B
MIIDKDYTRGIRLSVGLVLSLFVTASVMIDSGYLRFLDSIFIGQIQKNTGGFKDTIMHFTTTLASPKMDIIWIFILAFFMWGFKFKLQALWGIFTLAGADVIGFIVKNIVRRDRPVFHSASDTGFSFPSGHVLGIFIVVAVVWIVILPHIQSSLIRRLLYVLTFLFVLLVMVSRIYLNAHFPTDTVGAVIIGYTWVQVSEMLYVRYAPRLKQHWRPVLHSYL